MPYCSTAETFFSPEETQVLVGKVRILYVKSLLKKKKKSLFRHIKLKIEISENQKRKKSKRKPMLNSKVGERSKKGN